MKLKYPKILDNKSYINFFKSLSLNDLVIDSKRRDLRVNEKMKKQKMPYKPELSDLYRLYKFITLNKRLCVLEFGCGKSSIVINKAFIGSCTNGRLEDLREVARVLDGRQVHSGVQAMVVPGSTAVRRQAESEGLDKVFRDAGFEWREAGCSMCIGMNPDTLSAGERCASTTNRNFEGRQGRGGRTHLVSPATAAATAVAGRFADPRRT